MFVIRATEREFREIPITRKFLEMKTILIFDKLADLFTFALSLLALSQQNAIKRTSSTFEQILKLSICSPIIALTRTRNSIRGKSGVLQNCNRNETAFSIEHEKQFHAFHFHSAA